VGLLSPHDMPSIRPSEAAVPAVAAWVPPADQVKGGEFSVVFDFGQNYAGACELTLEGPTATLTGKHVNMRYGEALLPGPTDEQDVFHPWWPCTPQDSAPVPAATVMPWVRDSPTQGAHNCANQTDRYVVRGAPGAVGPITALGRVPMRRDCNTVTWATFTRQVSTSESYVPSHSIKGGRWVQVNGTAVTRSLRFSLNVTNDVADICAPASGVGHLVQCATPRAPNDVVLSVRFWPLHSDVAARGAVTLHARARPSTPGSLSSRWSVRGFTPCL